jgi:hypothetical protein
MMVSGEFMATSWFLPHVTELGLNEADIEEVNGWADNAGVADHSGAHDILAATREGHTLSMVLMHPNGSPYTITITD